MCGGFLNRCLMVGVVTRRVRLRGPARTNDVVQVPETTVAVAGPPSVLGNH
jgi:hypothetical protein